METIRRGAAWLVKNEFWLVWVYGIPFILSSNVFPLFAASLAAIPFFWGARRITRGVWTERTPLDLPLAILAVLGLVGVAVSIEPNTSWRMYAELVGGIALYYGIVNGLAQRNSAWGAWVLIGLALPLGFVGFLGLQYSEKFLPIRAMYDFLPKLNFAFLNPRGFTPNIVAGAIAPVIPLCWTWSINQNAPRIQRAVILIVSILLLGIVLLTQSRGAILGLAAALGVIFFWFKPRWIWILFVGGVALLFIVVGTGTTDLFEALLVTDSTGSAAGRWELWQRAFYIFQDFPFTGIGLGTFEQIVPMLYPLFLNDPTAPLPHAHNLYLQMGVEYGIGGLVAYLGLVTTVIITSWKNVRATGGFTPTLLALGLFAGWIVFLIHSFLDAVFVSTKVAVVIWVLLGTMMALALARRRV